MVMATLTMKVMSEAVGRCRSGYRLRTGVVAMTSQYHTMRNVCETPREQRTKTTGVQLRWTAATHQRRWTEREIYTKDCRVIEVMCRVLRQKKGRGPKPSPFLSDDFAIFEVCVEVNHHVVDERRASCNDAIVFEREVIDSGFNFDVRSVQGDFDDDLTLWREEQVIGDYDVLVLDGVNDVFVVVHVVVHCCFLLSWSVVAPVDNFTLPHEQKCVRN